MVHPKERARESTTLIVVGRTTERSRNNQHLLLEIILLQLDEPCIV